MRFLRLFALANELHHCGSGCLSFMVFAFLLSLSFGVVDAVLLLRLVAIF